MSASETRVPFGLSSCSFPSFTCGMVDRPLWFESVLIRRLITFCEWSETVARSREFGKGVKGGATLGHRGGDVGYLRVTREGSGIRTQFSGPVVVAPES